MPALPTPALQRAAELELERARRSGRPFSLLLLQLRRTPRAPRRRASFSRRTTDTAAQYLRPFDSVGLADRSRRLVIVVPDADGEAASHILPRLGAALDVLGLKVTGAGTSTYPDDGLLLTHLVEHAMSRLGVEQKRVVAAVHRGDASARVAHGIAGGGG